MGIAKERRYCPDEKRMVLAERQTPNHILHLLLTLVTMGVWIIPWVIITLASSGGYRCPNCGQMTAKYPPKGAKLANG